MYLPLSSAVAVPVLLPGNETLTVEPGSASPVTVLSVLFTSSTVGASGAVLSPTVTEVGAEVLSLSSTATTFSCSPPLRLASLGISTLKLPWSSALPSDSLPLGNVTFTVEPGSAVPVTLSSLLFTSLTSGASGAVLSDTTVCAGSETLAFLSLAVTSMFSPPLRVTSSGIFTV